MTMIKEDRIHAIDGIRGWASLIVVMFHFFWELFGAVIPGFRHPILSLLLNGPLAVYVFFVLSGDALAWPFLKELDQNYLNRQVLKRYLRLAVPILITNFIIYLIVNLGVDYHLDAAVIIGRAEWLGSMLKFDVTSLRWLSDSLFDVFLAPSQVTSVNPFLWTMQIELAGSILLFAVLYALPSFRYPKQIVLTFFVASFFANKFFCLFFAGLYFSLLRREQTLAKSRHKWISLALLLSVFAADYLFRNQNINVNWFNRLNSVLSILIVYAIYSNQWFMRFFSLRISQFLGRISYSLYLAHFAVLISFGSWLIVRFCPNGPSLEQGIWIGGVAVISSIMAATALQKIESIFLTRLDRQIRYMLK